MDQKERWKTTWCVQFDGEYHHGEGGDCWGHFSEDQKETRWTWAHYLGREGKERIGKCKDRHWNWVGVGQNVRGAGTAKEDERPDHSQNWRYAERNQSKAGGRVVVIAQVTKADQQLSTASIARNMHKSIESFLMISKSIIERELNYKRSMINWHGHYNSCKSIYFTDEGNT